MAAAGYGSRRAPGRRAVRAFVTGKLHAAVGIHRSTLIRNSDIGDEQRFAYRLPRKRRSLLEPGTRRGRAPQRLPPRVLQRPAQRLMIVVHGEVIAGVELQAMAIGIADVKKKRI